ncbi:D-amino-acid transaminase [Paenibacillus ginsengarvi]|uniref:D-alanine aminotransferase n=1 Tax=Paenibacillus ginsengarvi TaxID=400777 RepID=A0A3B0AVS0_9BACL|nr:D-amino-acid transaminase [Paenibacillus ginsengarvi]RKN64453.1 D-amino-acid transaminase [Paenibacillus ginsengarvi]
MIWMDDRFMPESEASVSYLDRGYCFGDGIYEMIRVYGGRLYEPSAHYERLERSAAEIKLSLPYPIEEINRIVLELLKRERLEEGTVYMQITRGVAPRAHGFPAPGTKPVLMAYCGAVKRPVEAMAAGISAITRPDVRWLRCDIKSLNLLGSVLAKQEAVEAGADDVILHRDGIITECSASNLMIVKDGVLLTHPANHLILNGITRAVVLELARKLNIPAIERPFTLQELTAADEAFLTSTIMEVMPIVRIDGSPVGDGLPGSITRKLQRAFEDTIPSPQRR